MKCNYCDCNQPIFTRKAEKALPLAFWQRPEYYFGARSKMLFCAKCFASYLSDIFSKLQIAALYSMQHLIFDGILSEKECQIFGRRLGGRIQGFNQSQSQIWFSIVKSIRHGQWFWWRLDNATLFKWKPPKKNCLRLGFCGDSLNLVNATSQCQLSPKNSIKYGTFDIDWWHWLGLNYIGIGQYDPL